ncbi:MAG: hypothetical protein KJ698_06485 [Actinobacteria bacterium]|nr:hypothetical protein [Actinomycetota bacterium]
MTVRRPAAGLVVAAVLLALSVPVRGAGPPLECDGVPATLSGTNGPDDLFGTMGRDVIAGGAGDDTIIGYGGDDLLCGGDGDDTVLGGIGADVVFGGSGDDIVQGGAGDDLLDGGSGDDDLRGDGGDDRILGGLGRDLLNGGPGDDALFGLGGRDHLIGGPGADALAGGRSADILAGKGGIDFLLGGDANDRLLGGGDSDVLEGGPGYDRGAGGDGGDLCSGVEVPGTCETQDPDLWDWVRTAPAGMLADRLRDLVVLQTGCLSPLDLDWAGVVAATFPTPGRRSLVGAVDDLELSADACNRSPDNLWRTGLRDALVHLEDFNALIGGGAPHPVGPLATAAEAAPAAADIAEATSAYLIGGNPPPAQSDFWWRLVHAGHTRQLEMAFPDRGYEVLFAGSSTVANAFDPSVFTRRDGAHRTAYNAAIGGSGPEIQALWLLEQAVELAQPDLVIIGVEDRAFRPFDLIPGSCLEPFDSWGAARDLRAKAFAPITALASSDEGALFFGDPAASAPTRPSALHDYFVTNQGPLGNRINYPPDLTLEQKQKQVKGLLPWSVGYEPCDERVAIIGGLAADLVSLGIEVVLVAMPVSDIRASAFDPDGGGDVAAGRAVIDALSARMAVVAADAGAGFIDLSHHPAILEDHFRDIGHLGASGATVFTRRLVGALNG